MARSTSSVASRAVTSRPVCTKRTSTVGSAGFVWVSLARGLFSGRRWSRPDTTHPRAVVGSGRRDPVCQEVAFAHGVVGSWRS